MAGPTYNEGDYVPGKGILMPDGTYRASQPGDVGDNTGDAVLNQTDNSSKTNSSGGGNDSGMSPEDMWTYAAKTGITQDQYNKLNATQQGLLAVVGESVGTLYSSGSSGVTLDDAINNAKNDPSIVQKYSDALSTDTNNFTDTLNQLQQSASITAKNQAIQFQNDRKQLADSEAAAGTAYSGFRGEAQKNLEDTESGIIQSSNAQNLNQLNTLRQNFASKYGTAATPTANISFTDPLNGGNTSISGLDQAGGNQTALSGSTPTLIGSAALQKNADINSLASTNYQTAQLPTL